MFATLAAVLLLGCASIIQTPRLMSGWVVVGGVSVHAGWMALPFLLIGLSSAPKERLARLFRDSPLLAASYVVATTILMFVLSTQDAAATMVAALAIAYFFTRSASQLPPLLAALVPLTAAALAASSSWQPVLEWLNNGAFFWEHCAGSLQGFSLFGDGTLDAARMEGLPSWSADFVAVEVVAVFGYAGIASGIAAFASVLALAAKGARSPRASRNSAAALSLAGALFASSLLSLLGLFLPLPLAGVFCPFVSDGTTTAIWSYAAAGAIAFGASQRSDAADSLSEAEPGLDEITPDERSTDEQGA